MSSRIFKTILVLSLLMLSIPSHAQSHRYLEYRERRAGEALDADGLVRLNRFTGEVTVVVPLLRIDARGEVGFTVNQTITTREDPSLSLIVGPGILRGLRVSTPGALPDQPIVGEVTTSTRLIYFSNDGEVVELLDAKDFGDSNKTICGSTPKNRGRLFLASDESGITFQSNDDISDAPCGKPPKEEFLPSGTIRHKDGRRYVVVDGRITLIEDRNGNQLRINGSQITDSIGRIYEVDESGVRYKGFGGATLSIAIEKENLSEIVASQSPTTDTDERMDRDFRDNINRNSTLGNISRIIFPEGEALEFGYNQLGEVIRLIHSSGWEILLTHDSSVTGSGRVLSRYELRRKSSDGDTLIKSVRFLRRIEDGDTLVIEEIAVGNEAFLGQNLTVFAGDAESEVILRQADPHHLGSDDAGLPKRIEVLPAGSSTAEKITLMRWKTPDTPDKCSNCMEKGFVKKLQESMTFHPLAEKRKRELFRYDEFGNLTDVFTYQIDALTETLLRRQHCSFVADATYTSIEGPHLRSLPEVCWISKDSTGSLKEQLVRYAYDETEQNELLNRSRPFGHDTARYGTRYKSRGNLTRRIRHRNPLAETGLEFSRTQYDILGNPVRVYDARGFSSTLSFVDRFVSRDGPDFLPIIPPEMQGRSAFAFPSIDSNNIGLRRTKVWDFHSGEIIREIDWNAVPIFHDPHRPRPMRFTKNLSSIPTIIHDGEVLTLSHVDSETNIFSNLSGTRYVATKAGVLQMEMRVRGERFSGRTISGVLFEGTTDMLNRVTSTSIGWVDDSGAMNDRIDRVFEYDARGNLLSEDDGSIRREFTYDGISRLIARSDPESGTTSYEYDEHGNVTSTADANGRRLVNRFDPLDRVASRWWVESSEKMLPLAEFEYDRAVKGRGRLNRAESLSETGIKFSEVIESYDDAGTPMEKSFWVNGRFLGRIHNAENPKSHGPALGYPSGRTVIWNKSVASNEMISIEQIGTQRKLIATDFADDTSILKYRNQSGLVFSTMRDTVSRSESARVHRRRGLGLLSELISNPIRPHQDSRWGFIQGMKTRETYILPKVGRHIESFEFGFDIMGRQRSRINWNRFSDLRRSLVYDRNGNRAVEASRTNDIPRRCLVDKKPTFCPTELNTYFPRYSKDNRFIRDQDGDGLEDYSYDTAGRLLKDSIGRRFRYDPIGNLVGLEIEGKNTITRLEVIRDAWGRIVGITDVASRHTDFYVRDAEGKILAEFASGPKRQSGGGLLHAFSDAGGMVRAMITEDARLKPFPVSIDSSVCIDILPGCNPSDMSSRIADVLVLSDRFALDAVMGRYTTPILPNAEKPFVTLISKNLYQRNVFSEIESFPNLFRHAETPLDYFFSPPKRYNGREYFEIADTSPKNRW